MNDQSFTIRVPRRWVRIALIVGVVALIVAPLTAVAGHSFNDVPDSHTFHADIAWLADAGVTKGCNPPANTEFCPEDNVTRGQMGAFMRRFAQYIDAEDGTPAQADNATNATNADDADALDGSTKAELAPRAAFNALDDAPDGESLTLSAEITAPAPGILLMSGGVEAFGALANPNFYGCRLEVDDGVVVGSQMFSDLGADSDTNEEDCTTSGAATVSAGTHTIDLEVTGVAATSDLVDASVWALWVPFDGTGAIPTAITQLGTPDEVDDPENR